MAAGPFTKEKLLAELGPMEEAIKEPIAREKKAVAARKEGGPGGFGMPGGGAVFGASVPPRRFIEKRVESVADQLAEKKKGYVPNAFGFGPPPGGGFGGPPRIGELLPRPVQDQLKLTPDQRRKLAELQKEVDEKVEKLLDEAQREALRRMREGRPGGGPPRP
jgi:hypothetical protein